MMTQHHRGFDVAGTAGPERILVVHERTHDCGMRHRRLVLVAPAAAEVERVVAAVAGRVVVRAVRRAGGGARGYAVGGRVLRRRRRERKQVMTGGPMTRQTSTARRQRRPQGTLGLVLTGTAPARTRPTERPRLRRVRSAAGDPRV